jgi:hypothetical protein
MARRATFFSKFDDPNTLRIAGPYEFAKWSPAHPLNPERITPLIRGYEHLSYDLGVLGTSESNVLSHLSGTQTEKWFQVVSHPQVHSLQTGRGLFIAVVFPALEVNTPPSTSMIQNLVATLNELRSDHPNALIVGISSWGRESEKQFIEKHEGSCNILLGSGPGPGLTSTVSTHAQTLWTRSYSKGRTVTKIEIREFPTADRPLNWITGRNISAQLVLLGKKIQENPGMNAILAPLNVVAKVSASSQKRRPCGK